MTNIASTSTTGLFPRDYRVATTEILTDIINETNHKIQSWVDSARKNPKSDFIMTCKLSDKYEVTTIVNFKNIEKVPCPYCEKENELAITYIIENIQTEYILETSDYMLHLMNHKRFWQSYLNDLEKKEALDMVLL